MRIGLTGGIACGKSTAAQIFLNQGCVTLHTDQIAHQILEEEKTKDALRARWGNAVFTPQGSPDRAAIGSIVFNRPEEKVWLENILHPIVHQRWKEASLAAAGKTVVVEIPLLFEKNLETNFDLIVCVHCSHTTQLARMAKRGLDIDQAETRLRNQWPLDEKMRRAGFCLFNEGDPSFLERQILFFLSRLKTN